MKLLQIFFPLRTSQSKMLGSSLVLALFLFLQALSASTALHHLFHSDEGHADHQCAVTLLSQGHLEAPETALSFSAPATSAEFVPLPQVFVLATVDYRLLPGRAPPAFRS